MVLGSGIDQTNEYQGPQDTQSRPTSQRVWAIVCETYERVVVTADHAWRAQQALTAMLAGSLPVVPLVRPDSLPLVGSRLDEI